MVCFCFPVLADAINAQKSFDMKSNQQAITFDHPLLVRRTIIIIIIFSLFVAGLYLHILRMPEDRAVESEMFFTLSKGSEYHGGSYFSSAEYVCFLPSYATSDGIKIPLSESVRHELDIKIKFNPFGTGDSFWWIVGVRKDNVMFIYKMTGRIRQFPLNKTVCVDAQKIVLKPLHNLNFDSGSVYFDRKIVYFEVSSKQE